MPDVPDELCQKLSSRPNKLAFPNKAGKHCAGFKCRLDKLHATFVGCSKHHGNLTYGEDMGIKSVELKGEFAKPPFP
jgi:hypothetical protein